MNKEFDILQIRFVVFAILLEYLVSLSVRKKVVLQNIFATDFIKKRLILHVLCLRAKLVKQQLPFDVNVQFKGTGHFCFN